MVAILVPGDFRIRAVAGEHERPHACFYSISGLHGFFFLDSVRLALSLDGESASRSGHIRDTRTAPHVVVKLLHGRAFVLLAGAGLMIGSLVGLLGVTLGFDPKNVVTNSLSVGSNCHLL
jgi:hypothetical protein